MEQKVIIDFPHKQLSHCENGAICNLLNYNDFDISEPLIFGIGSGIFFAYMPFVKNYDIPLTSYRIMPGQIYKNATKRLNVKMFKRTYKDKQKAMDELDEMLEKRQPVGLLTNLYYLPFFPKSYRFHYNAHNTIIYGKDGNNYLVSDPVLEDKATISYEDLLKARFAKGIISVKGDMYFPISIPENQDISRSIKQGMQATKKLMIKNPIPYHGITGIKLLAKRIRKEKDNTEFIKAFLGNIIRIQEEAGTGGAGFRYMYAAFLQQAAKILQQDQLYKTSEKLTQVGDTWREFGLNAGRILKGRSADQNGTFNIINDILLDIADREKEIFQSF